MAQNPENPLNNLGLKTAAVYLQQKADTTGQLRDGMVSGDVESVSGSVAGIKTVLYEAQVMKEEIDKQIVAIRETLGYLPAIRFSLMTQHGFLQGITEEKPEPGTVVETAVTTEKPGTVFTPPIAEVLPRVKEPVVIAEPLGFFVQEISPAPKIDQIEPVITISEPEKAIETVNTPLLDFPPVVETEPDEFVFELESEDDTPDHQISVQSPTWVDRRQFVPDAGELTFKTEHMPTTYVTTLAKAIIDAYRAGTLVQAGVNLRRIDLSTIQGLVSDKDLADLKKLSPDAQDDVMYGIVEKLMDYSKSPTRTLQDELGHDGYLLLDLLGPSIRSKEQVLDLIDALPFENETDFRELYGSTRRPQITTVSQKPRKLSKAQLDRQVAGGDSSLTQRQVNAFNRQTSVSTRKKGNVSPEAQAARELMENIESTVVYNDRGLLVTDKRSGVAEKGDSTVGIGVLEAISNVYRNQPWFLLDNLDRSASGLVILSGNRQLLDYWKGDRRLGIEDNIQFLYQVFLQGEIPEAVTWERELAKLNATDKLTVIQSAADRIQTASGSNVRLKMQLKPTEIFVNVMGKKVTQAELVLSGTDQQARAILAAQDIPVVGDRKYAPVFTGVSASRPMIHAEKARLINPKTKEPFPEISTDLPEDFAEFKNRLTSVYRISS